MSKPINNKWTMRYTFNAIRRHLTEEISQYSIDRLRIELIHAMNKLDIVEKEFKNV